jgi:hypothetical protein
VGDSRYDVGLSCSRSESNTTIFKISYQGRHQEATPTPQRKFIRETHSMMSQSGRYGSVFNGHCFSCNEYGHRALYCRHHGRKYVGRFVRT